MIRDRLSIAIIHALNKKKLEAREYEFRGYVSPFDVYRKLSQGLHKLHRVVVAEGSDLYDIADILEKEGVCKREDFLRYATSKPHQELRSLNTDNGGFPLSAYTSSKNTTSRL
ncbi:MAG: hypothetical protein Q9N34_07575 [Aquificota bacterium]|nr:hypothetical protein [Aquificota bacterium]